ncbi:HupE/UreJ family protein [Methylomonas fluvii]|uniref:HupE/UreJ family protein n=1 Tax=Methylomonas fluvii TaxID=1854564 RepID=A0ABR9DEU1_9GAMM|nr:HupE/UreJ family protein [Methylomonas fluvii]MBD9361617.1 HupE/UreJ family protein [Methylomonas fluvii]CAD6874598.1 hypothetical protein [Methylomonas fluvii]
MKSKARYFQKFSLAGLALAQPIVATAHPMHWASESIGFLSGFIHPITSSDHIFTMLAVGLLVSKVSKKAICLMFLFFVTLMLIGGVLTLIPVEIVYAENVMHFSALLLGLTIISGHKVSSLIAMPLVANFALFHGYVHAYDIWLDADAFSYTVGFALATATLILVGIGIRSLIDRLVPEDDTHVFGGSFHR